MSRLAHAASARLRLSVSGIVLWGESCSAHVCWSRSSSWSWRPAAARCSGARAATRPHRQPWPSRSGVIRPPGPRRRRSRAPTARRCRCSSTPPCCPPRGILTRRRCPVFSPYQTGRGVEYRLSDTLSTFDAAHPDVAVVRRHDPHVTGGGHRVHRRQRRGGQPCAGGLRRPERRLDGPRRRLLAPSRVDPAPVPGPDERVRHDAPVPRRGRPDLRRHRALLHEHAPEPARGPRLERRRLRCRRHRRGGRGAAGPAGRARHRLRARRRTRVAPAASSPTDR